MTVDTELPVRMRGRELVGYSVTAEGRVRGPSGKWLKLSLMTTGYLAISVWNGKRSATVAVHPLVCEAFHGPRPSPEHQVRHRNGVRTDNRAVNLVWGTSKENHADMDRHGRRVDNSGESSGNARLTWERVRRIRARYAAGGISIRALAEMHDVAPMTVHKVVTGQTWLETKRGK